MLVLRNSLDEIAVLVDSGETCVVLSDTLALVMPLEFDGISGGTWWAGTVKFWLTLLGFELTSFGTDEDGWVVVLVSSSYITGDDDDHTNGLDQRTATLSGRDIRYPSVMKEIPANLEELRRIAVMRAVESLLALDITSCAEIQGRAIKTLGLARIFEEYSTQLEIYVRAPSHFTSSG